MYNVVNEQPSYHRTTLVKVSLLMTWILFICLVSTYSILLVTMSRSWFTHFMIQLKWFGGNIVLVIHFLPLNTNRSPSIPGEVESEGVTQKQPNWLWPSWEVSLFLTSMLQIWFQCKAHHCSEKLWMTLPLLHTHLLPLVTLPKPVKTHSYTRLQCC